MQPNNFNTQKTTIQIKNMVSSSCIKVVQWTLTQTGFIQVEKIELGKAEIAYDTQIINLEGINQLLMRQGFSLLHDKNAMLVEQIKITVIQLIFYGNNTHSIIRNSDYLAERLGHSYVQLSKIFSEKTHHTLEKFIIQIKIEKVKELLIYDELTLSEISYQMGYSSVQYLSNQFKQITGITVNDYKKTQTPMRVPLDSL